MDEEQRAAERREDAALVERARADDSEAFGRLYDRWLDRVHDLAFRITHDSAAAADIAQDAFLAAWRNLAGLQDPEAFGGWLLRITRNAALDRHRREVRSRPYDERDAELLDLTLRHGLTPAEVGEVVGMNRNAANQAVHRVRGRLKAAIEARVLWRSGEPVCAGLAAALDQLSETSGSGGAGCLVGGEEHEAQVEEQVDDLRRSYQVAAPELLECLVDPCGELLLVHLPLLPRCNVVAGGIMPAACSLASISARLPLLRLVPC